MSKFTIVAAIAIVTGLSGCMENTSPTAKCAGAGALAGGALGAVTDNNVATSALVGGALGAVAGEAGACR